MATISSTGPVTSTGLGSGINVEDIITKMKEVETARLKPLAADATLTKTKISTYGNLQSLLSTLQSAATKLADATSSGLWGGITATSGNTAAVTVASTGAAQAGSYDVSVSQLARAQTVASSAVAPGTALGAGTLTFTLGSWATDGSGKATGFTAGSAGAISVSFAEGEDSSLAAVARKINDAGTGVVASVVTDSSGQRLVFRSATTGQAAGFKIDASSGSSNGMKALAFDATTATGTFQLAQDSVATVNGISVSSASKTFEGVIPGVTFKVSQVTTSPVGVDVAADTAGMTKAVQDFVNAYNAVNSLLTTSTKYDAGSKTAGVLQADSTAVSLRSALRNMATSTTTGGTLSGLSGIGIDTQKDGTLVIDAGKLASALATPANVKALFSASTGDSSNDGIALKFRTALRSMLAFDGTVATKSNSLQTALDSNAKDQDRVNDRWTATEARLRATYTALDAKMASLNALDKYVSQQVATWNKSTG